MDQYNRKSTPDNDATGEIISWVIVFILLFAFWPVGLFLLIRKLRGYSRSAGNARNQATRQASYTAYTAQQARQSAENAAREAGATTRQAASQAAGATRQAASQAAGAARQATSQAGDAARDAAREVRNAARQGVHDIRDATRNAASQYGNFARQAGSEVYSDTAREAYAAQKSYSDSSNKKKDRNPLERKTGKFLSTIMLIISILMLILGVTRIATAVQNITDSGVTSLYDIYMGAFFLIGGVISFFSRNVVVRRIARYKKYYALASGRDIVPITEIAQASGKPVRTVTRDLQAMIIDGHFGASAYIDSELGCIVFSPAAAKEMRAKRSAGANASAYEPAPPAAAQSENQYMSIILELRELNQAITDIPISDKIDKLEELAGKIFRIVEEDPEKLPQIRRFMNYYLPTTLKLLHSYATLEKQGVKGENITAAKQNIERILNTLVTGYEQQLDQLFKSDALDIAADINVLENLMQQDGLTGDKPELQTMEGSMQ